MKSIAFLALAVAGVCWGLGFPTGKLILTETDAAHMVLLRFIVAALAAAPFALRAPEVRALFKSPVVLLSGGLYGVAFMVQFEGLAHVSVTVAALLVGAMPALIAVSAKVLGEKVTPASWAGVAAATLGAALIAGKPDGASSPLGVALSIGALFLFLAWLLVLRKAPKAPNAMAIPAVSIIVAAAAVLPIAFLMHGPPKLSLSAPVWAGILAQGVLATLLATAAWQFGAARVGAASAGVFINIEPLIGAACGVLLFGDRLTPFLLAGGCLIIGGSLAVVLGEKHAAPGELQATVAPTP
ncbi:MULTISPECIES: DMT family transporter [Caulobacter]|jgi:drug/metabolite transporter (DMT)-like permease|uniref:Putative permease, DMT superfamily n=1 Tax=Caulobacter vibrioides OR37 TaxID=1292034 RepID=R0EBD9_CAUVI|nr:MULTISPECIES: DMT family transporter [Caulobacter]ENZ82773.1 putative permease, DMT superfamily [Caulobacter vibrioides OR37]MBQ1559524.1 DMT family transporter [Caulobacter sp.]